jgi:hypothetical protein
MLGCAVERHSALFHRQLTFSHLHCPHDALTPHSRSGFYVHGCPKMRYKGGYRPSDLLCPARQTWHALADCVPLLDANKYVEFSDSVAPVVDGDGSRAGDAAGNSSTASSFGSTTSSASASTSASSLPSASPHAPVTAASAALLPAKLGDARALGASLLPAARVRFGGRTQPWRLLPARVQRSLEGTATVWAGLVGPKLAARMLLDLD